MTRPHVDAPRGGSVARTAAVDPDARPDAPFEGGAPRSPARWVARTLDLVAIAASVAVAGLMLFLVVARYVLGLSIVGLHELILASALLLYMTGALIASRRREHLTVDWLAGRLTAPRARALHGCLVAAVTVVVAGFFVVWSWDMIAWGLERPQATPAYRIPVWTLQLPILVAAVGCLLYALRDLLDAGRALLRR